MLILRQALLDWVDPDQRASIFVILQESLSERSRKWLDRTRSDFEHSDTMLLNVWPLQELVHSLMLLGNHVFHPVEVVTHVDVRPHWLAALSALW